MKNHFVKILFLSLVITVGYAHAQTNVTEAQFKHDDVALDKFLTKKFSEEEKKIELPQCIISSVFVKFTVDSTGNVNKIVFSSLTGTPPVFRTILQSTILATNGFWVPRKINGKAVESKPFILPLVYELEAGCTVLGPDSKPIYKTARNDVTTSLLHILDFDGKDSGNQNQLDCILLAPIHIFSAN